MEEKSNACHDVRHFLYIIRGAGSKTHYNLSFFLIIVDNHDEMSDMTANERKAYCKI